VCSSDLARSNGAQRSAEVGPTLGRPLVDRIEVEPDHRELIPLFGR